MLQRLAAGDIPAKHHIALRDGLGVLRYEHCLTRDGFDGAYTIAYHQNRPHADVPVETKHGFELPALSEVDTLLKRHYRTSRLELTGGASIDARVPLLFNDDVVVSMLSPSAPDPEYFANGDADDLFFIVQGSGLLRSVIGDLRFQTNDYVYAPKGLPYRFVPDQGVAQRWLSLECKGGLWIPRKFRNETGQLRMDAPYCHRDFRFPTFVGPMDEGIRRVLVKRSTTPRAPVFHTYELRHSPLDVVGFDGTVYPFAFPILNFQPRAGLVHLPPDWHGTFALRGGLVCSFVPRVVDFHPEAIPCPYPHASVDCDEVLFYVDGDFMSRVGIERGSMSHHPAGVSHGPHPFAYEKSLGVSRTDELAVMMDTTRPLARTSHAERIEDIGYHLSFL